MMTKSTRNYLIFFVFVAFLGGSVIFHFAPGIRMGENFYLFATSHQKERYQQTMQSQFFDEVEKNHITHLPVYMDEKITKSCHIL